MTERKKYPHDYGKMFAILGALLWASLITAAVVVLLINELTN